MNAPSPFVELVMGLDEPDDEASIRSALGRKLRVDPSELGAVVLRKRSLDCRRGRVRIRLIFERVSENRKAWGLPHPREVEIGPAVVVIGMGPAGLFCAYQLARAGIQVTVLDRGKPVQPRRKDLKGLTRRGVVDPDSNYCFGEGGAGTYSDGKLYTRSQKRGDVRDVLEILCLHGAPESILTDARPHIGSNLLPRVVTALRERLESVGVEFRFGARVVGVIKRGVGSASRLAGVRLADGTEVSAERVVLATGHSARDVYTMLLESGVSLEPKPFALGVRIEHPQGIVNRAQYGRHAGHAKLPAASYKLIDSRAEPAVFSFCMCPGGFIVPASTSPGEVVLNGMSLSRRDSRYANSGVVVSIGVEAARRAFGERITAGLELQSAVEQAAFAAGGGELRAPATRLTDFVAGRSSSTLPGCSYVPGLTAGDIDEVLAHARCDLGSRLREAVVHFDGQLEGYLTDEAVVVATESRTSSPLRIPRDTTLQSPDLSGLYPCGEGAGYAGGIMSAALDGLRVARRIESEVLVHSDASG